jgi:hypothetical protein
VERHIGELFPRVGFIITNLRNSSKNIVAFYNKRGTAEQWIKEWKGALKGTRLSCRSFNANAVRLQLHALAYNLGNFLVHARDSRGDCGLVAHESAREGDQDWCQGRQPRSLRHVSDGGGRDPSTVIRFDHAENCRFAAPNGYGNMSTPATERGKNNGKVRPYGPSASLFFAQWPIRPPIIRHCSSSGRRRPPETTGSVDFGSNTLAISRIPA